MVLSTPLSASKAVLMLAGFVLSGCGGASDPMVVFRDLADIPERPGVTARDVNDQALESLAEDRARAAQAADSLRDAPFITPEPAPVSPDP
jgi:hypothetical protein